MNNQQETEQSVVRKGLEAVRIKLVGSAKTNLRRFLSYYGTQPRAVAFCWEKLRTTNIEAARRKPGDDIKDLFVALFFFKNYPKEAVLMGTFGFADEKTARRKALLYRQRLSALKPEMIVLPPVDPESPEIIWLIIDCTDCPIEEPQPWTSKWYSHKFEGPAIKYEIATSFAGDVAWGSEPYRGGKGDREIFQDRLQGLTPENCVNLVDLGYVKDGLAKVTHIRPTDSAADRKLKKRLLARQETLNGRLKNYAVLSHRYRHNVKDHSMDFNCCLVLCQMEIECGFRLFEV